MWQRILVPHDFSSLGFKAFTMASHLAEQFQSEIVLLHVTDLAGEIDPDAMITPDGEAQPLRVSDYTARGARQRLQKIAARWVPERVRCEVAFGDTGRRILDTAEAMGVDVIVMGTHGRTGLSHALLGSVAEHVLRRAKVPVVVCRGAGSDAALTAEEMLVQDELAG